MSASVQCVFISRLNLSTYCMSTEKADSWHLTHDIQWEYVNKKDQTEEEGETPDREK